MTFAPHTSVHMRPREFRAPQTPKRTDDEAQSAILAFCAEPKMRKQIILGMRGNRTQVGKVIDQMCIDGSLTVTWKMTYFGDSGRKTAFLTSKVAEKDAP